MRRFSVHAVTIAIAVALVAAPINNRTARAGLVGHWTLDDGVGDPASTTAEDSAGTNDGTLQNFTAPPGWSTGKAGGALDFDGSNNKVNAGNGGSLDITGAFSLSLWMKVGDSITYYGHLAGKDQYGGSVNDAYFLKWNSDRKLILGASDGTLRQWNGNATINDDDQWHHVAGVFDPNQRVSLYIDGQLDAEHTSGIPGSVHATTANFTIGLMDFSGTVAESYNFNGELDDVQLYNVALSDEQIKFLFDTPGATVPEPASALLLALACLLLTLAARRRRCR